MTHVQLRNATLLAAGLGHEWAVARMRHADTSTTIDTIRDFTRNARSDHSPPGIEFPGLNEFGEIAHESATGRISYLVAESGDIRIDVWRPPGFQCLHLELDAALRFVIAYATSEARERHYDALVETLSCVFRSRGFAYAVIDRWVRPRIWWRMWWRILRHIGIQKTQTCYTFPAA